jgi:VWFA-related protein
MKSGARLQWLMFLVAFPLFASAARGADGPKVALEPRPKPAAPAPKTDIRVDTTVVLIPVTVTDSQNKFVTGLEKENFRLYEDKVEQQISYFTSDDSPISIGLVFDASGSMRNKLRKARHAVAEFLKSANPEDEFFLIEFNDRPELAQDFTANLEYIQNRLLLTQATGRTALLDAVMMAFEQMKKARNPRKALLIISDGGDNGSRYTESEIRRVVRETDIQIYATGIFEPFLFTGRSAEEFGGPGLLNDLARQTGGRHFAVENLSDLPDVAAKIGAELRNRYILGYSPTSKERDGKYHKVTVKLIPPKNVPPMRASFRQGYYAPTQ